MTPEESRAVGESLGPLKHVAWFAVIGAAIGLGNMLTESTKVTWRFATGRCIVSAGIAASAPIALAWMPQLPLAAQYGIAAGLASLGTSGLTLMFQRFLSK